MLATDQEPKDALRARVVQMVDDNALFTSRNSRSGCHAGAFCRKWRPWWDVTIAEIVRSLSGTTPTVCLPGPSIKSHDTLSLRKLIKTMHSFSPTLFVSTTIDTHQCGPKQYFSPYSLRADMSLHNHALTTPNTLRPHKETILRAHLACRICVPVLSAEPLLRLLSRCVNKYHIYVPNLTLHLSRSKSSWT